MVLLATKNRAGMTLYLHKNLEALVSKHDWTYLRGLIPDLVERANREADELFEQLCSLSSGPIQADEKEWLDPISIPKRFPDLEPVG